MPTGTVQWYSSRRDFGFIRPDDGSKDVYVHINAVERSGLGGLNAGQKVQCDTERGRWPGQINAVNIQPP
jgi:CspA family cold shock protein